MKVRAHHELPEDDIIEHEASMNCLCTPYVTNWVDAGDEGNVVIIAHRTFESTAPKPKGGLFGGGNPWLGWSL